jgi:hypothetical protein
VSDSFTREEKDGAVTYRVVPADYPIGGTLFIPLVFGFVLLFYGADIFFYGARDIAVVGVPMMALGAVCVVPTGIKLLMNMQQISMRKPYAITISSDELVVDSQRFPLTSIKEIWAAHPKDDLPKFTQVESVQDKLAVRVATNIAAARNAAEDAIKYQIFLRQTGNSQIFAIARWLSLRTASSLCDDIGGELRRYLETK